MPAAPKSPQSNKSTGAGGPGIPKPKGAVRAKSGCYTCRIRRKKCDERSNIDGHCETCVRLRLQCLGFGAKRPEWLRESRNVSEMRDKIKAFLAAQGMIKGHAGTGPRGADHEHPILRLEEDSVTPSSSESPPTPTLSLSPSETPRTLQHISSIREQRSWGVYDMPRTSSPFDGSSHSSHHDLAMYPASAQPYSSTSLVQWSGSSVKFPALSSSFGPHYSAMPVFDIEEDQLYFMEGPTVDISDPSPLPPFGNLFTTPILKPGGASDELLAYYFSNVVSVQYMLADDEQVQSVVIPSVNRLGSSRNAARLLASVHARRSQYNSTAFIALEDTETKNQYNELLAVLQKPAHDEDDALAAISIISTFLFDGGAGAWRDWLRVSYSYAQGVFAAGDPRDTLQTCPASTRFIVKTAIWFDVLAAITTQEAPWFLHYVRKLFSPTESRVFDETTPLSPELSMMDVMGCENVVLWVLAEASALAAWKQQQQAQGALSVPELVERAAALEKELDAAVPALDALPFNPSERQSARALSSDIFRGAARVYLRSIVSGDFPHVREIAEAVDETVNLVASRDPPPSVVRSTVFAFFVCGALTDDQRHRDQIINKLSLHSEAPAMSTVGNSPAIKALLEQIWRLRQKNQPVGWRDVLRRSEMLLV